MKVALVLDYYDPNRGGVEKWTAQLVDRLLRLRHTVHVIAGGFNRVAVPPEVVTHVIKKQFSRIAHANEAAQLLQNLDLDVIHDMGFGWYCDILQPHGGSRRASFEQNLQLLPKVMRPIKRTMSKILPRYREFDQLLARQYRPNGPLVLALSNLVQQDLKQYHNVPDEQIRLIYNGVDTVRFSPERCAEYREPMRLQLGMGDEPLILIVAHNHRLKGVATLLHAAAGLLQRGHKFQVAVVGGKARGKMYRLALRLEIQDKIHFAGPIEDPIGYYSAADIYVQPTYYDPCSLVVLEALACGLPVITTRFNGAGEIITPKREGIVLDDPADHDVLSIAMAQLLDDQRRAQMAVRARQLAEHHTLERNVQQVLAVYEEVLARKQRDAGPLKTAA